MESEVKTRITPLEQLQFQREPGEDCLVVIYTKDTKNFGKRHLLLEEIFLLGRGAENHLILESDSVSRKHCRIERRGGDWFIVDLGSTNGTYVNDEQVRTHRLNRGDHVKVGDTIFKYLSGSDVETQYHETIYRMAIIDGLTGVHNKRYIVETLEREISRARRHGRPLSLLLCDIDYFKYLNDNYGHLAGDFILKELVSSLKKTIRPDDVIGRYGGEEFLVVLPETDLEGALEVGERLRKTIEGHQYIFEGEHIEGQLGGGITISIGAAQLREGWDMNAFIQSTDAQLYAAKNAGRNQVRG